MNVLVDTPYRQLRLSEVELCSWFGQAGIGDTVVYHRGSLAHDRSQTASRLSRRDQAALTRIARRALMWAEAELADLVQQRHGNEDFSYILIVRRRPRCSKSLAPSIPVAEEA
jgi:hypothetical protein